MQAGARQLVGGVFVALFTVGVVAPATAKHFAGSKKANRVVGTQKSDSMRLGAGNDRARARGGADRVFGGRGSDRVAGNRGSDRVTIGDEHVDLPVDCRTS